jgi:hypothetical protein
MSGRNKTLISIAAAFVLISGILMCAPAGERKLAFLGEDFRIGAEGGAGLRMISGVGFQWYGGLLLKFKERVSVILNVGSFPFETAKTVTNYNNTKTVQRHYDFMGHPNIDATVRYEFLLEVKDTTTRFIFDTERRQFKHPHYYRPFRPYVQMHAGSFVGAGGGILLYPKPYFAIGFGADAGYNIWTASEEASKNDDTGLIGLGIIVPRVVIAFAF